MPVIIWSLIILLKRWSHLSFAYFWVSITRSASKQMQEEMILLPPAASHPNSADKWNLICESSAKSETGGTKAKLNSPVSTAPWIPGQCGTSEFLSLPSRITVSWNWKHREIQILTLLDICMTLGTLKPTAAVCICKHLLVCKPNNGFLWEHCSHHNWDKEAAVQVSFCPSYNII